MHDRPMDPKWGSGSPPFSNPGVIDRVLTWLVLYCHHLMIYNVNPGLVTPKWLFKWEGTMKKYQMK